MVNIVILNNVASNILIFTHIIDPYSPPLTSSSLPTYSRPVTGIIVENFPTAISLSRNSIRPLTAIGNTLSLQNYELGTKWHPLVVLSLLSTNP